MGNPIPSRDARAMLDDEGGLRELRLLYNHAEDDSRQFTRWQMVTAINHGIRLARADAYEQAAMVADDHGQAWGLSYRTMTDAIANAIRARALSDQPDSTNEGLAELLWEARDWIHHKAGCAINDPGNYSGRCTCGSAQLWGRIDTALSAGRQA